jgi:hypothetical protein
MIFFLQKTGQQLLTMLGVLFIATVVFKSHYHSFEKEPKEKREKKII